MTRTLPSMVTTSTIGTIGFRLSGAVGGVLAARLLGPTGRGHYAVLVVVATALGLLATAGLQFWVTLQVARPGGDTVAPVIRRHLRVTAVGASALLAAGLVVAPALGLASPVEVAATVLLAVATTWSMVELAVPNGLLRMGAVAGITTASGLTFLVWMMVGLASDVASPAFAVVGAAVANLVMVPLARRHRRLLVPAGSGAPAASGRYREALRFGWPLGVGELLVLATTRLDIVLVAMFLPLPEVGLYAVALALSELLWVVPDGVAQVLLPHVARREGRAPTGILLLSAGVVMLGGGLILVALSGPIIATIFGPSYADAGAALPLLVVAATAMGGWKMVGAELVARGESRARATSALLALAVMVVAGPVLTPRFGIAGAAAGSALAYGAAATHLWVRRQRCQSDLPMAREEAAAAAA